MTRLRKILPDHLRFLIWVHVILLVIFTIFRYVTLMVNRPEYLSAMGDEISLKQAFWMGFKFDILVASYALLIPYLLLTHISLKNIESPRILKFVRYYCTVMITVCLLICAADVPYFNFFNSRLTTSAVNWKNLGQVIKYIFQEVKYYPVFVVSIVGIWGIGRMVRYFWNKVATGIDHSSEHKLHSAFLAGMLLMIGLFGGTIPKRPDMKSATFTNNGFLNQLTLNPVHTWFDSYFEFDIRIMSLEAAVTKVQNDFSGNKENYLSPVAKMRKYDEPARKMNVVLVLLESMSAERMGIFGNKKNMTPGLDSMARTSVFFDNCYSNGIHTNAGIYSTLYSMPIMMMQHPMNNGMSEKTTFSGLPNTLKELGYQTEFFCTHPKTFDNLDVFLVNNGFAHVSDVADYPDSVVVNTWGVADETLYDYARKRLSFLDTTEQKKPFFATILSISNHPPYTLPPNTKYKPYRPTEDAAENTVQYSDWAVRNFLNACKKEAWYENTMFVFVGDHGVNIPGPFDVPLSYNRVPLIVHSPKLFNKPERRNQLANQSDIFPTVMGLLQKDYVQNSFGYDLFREKRPFAIFSQDLKMGVIDEKHLYIARKSGKETLYEYKTAFGLDISKEEKEKVKAMKNYACSQLLVSQWMIENQLTNGY